MTTELYWLTLTCLLTSLLWIPYILNRIVTRGLPRAMGNPQSDDKPHSQWADRSIRAHDNAVENLVVFAALVLVAHVAGVSSALTIAAAEIYFFARLAHYLIYLFGIPYLRTLTFAVGWIMQLIFALSILGII